MRGRRIFRVLKVVAIVIVAFTVFGFVAAHLWNYLMPGLFGLRPITFWQAVGLIVLGRLLFGGFRPGFGGPPWRRHMMARWEQMTPEEREKFRAGWRGGCGRASSPASEPNRSPAA
jgi:hypothetical protein